MDAISIPFFGLQTALVVIMIIVFIVIRFFWPT